MVVLEGTPCPGLFVVHSGTVKIFKTSPAGREQVLTIEQPGRAVAELAVLDDGPYPASAAANENAVLLMIPKNDFHNRNGNQLRAAVEQNAHASLKALSVATHTSHSPQKLMHHASVDFFFDLFRKPV